MPTDEQLVDAWVTLGEIHPSTIDGTLTSYHYDTPSAVSHARATIELVLESRHGNAMWKMLFDAQDSRSAEAHA